MSKLRIDIPTNLTEEALEIIGTDKEYPLNHLVQATCSHIDIHCVPDCNYCIFNAPGVMIDKQKHYAIVKNKDMNWSDVSLELSISNMNELDTLLVEILVEYGAVISNGDVTIETILDRQEDKRIAKRAEELGW